MLPENTEELGMRRLLTFLSEVDYRQSPPVLGREMHRMIRQELNNPDPYLEIKEKYNRMIMEKYSDFKKSVRTAEDPFDAAMRLAIAGNVIDFGTQHQMDIIDTINRVMDAELAIDDSQQLKDDLKVAGTVLYIGDNCGEIVFDKIFLETIRLPDIYFAVRGSPVINDVTVKDAETVKMDEVATVITTGDDAPGVVWESTSDEFKQIFGTADVVISKGQGNMEGLIDIQKNIYFLLVTKCELIGNRVGCRMGEFLVKRSPYMQTEPGNQNEVII